MIYEILFILPIGYFFIRTIKEVYYHIEKLDDYMKRNYNYLQVLMNENKKNNDDNYKLLNNQTNTKYESLKLNVKSLMGDNTRIKYTIDDLYQLIEKYNQENIIKIGNINDKIEEFNEDMKIMKSIYNITITELKDDIIDASSKIEEKYNNLNNAISYEKMSNELAFNNVLNKIKDYNNNEYKITFSNINQIIKNHNIENIGTNYFINISKNNYRDINKDYSTCNYKCSNVINYKISIYQDNEKIIISKPHNNNYLLINISYNISLTFFKNDLIGTSQDVCYVLPNLDIDNEYPKILKDNELEEYNKSIKLLNENYEIVKQEINRFVKKELKEVSLEPLITHYLV